MSTNLLWKAYNENLSLNFKYLTTWLGSLFSVDFLQNLEDLYEEVDDVQVELDGGQDVLLGAESGHDHLRVHDDEQREEEGPAHRQRRVRQLVAEEDLQEAAEDEDHEPGAEDRVQVGEVTLGLE